MQRDNFSFDTKRIAYALSILLFLILSVVSISINSSPRPDPPQLINDTILSQLDLYFFEKTRAPYVWVPIVSSEITIFVLNEDVNVPPEPSSVERGAGADVDGDGDGVFDDVERYIGQGYIGFPEVRLALYKYAYALKKIFEAHSPSSSDLSAQIEAHNLSIVAQQCVIDAAGSEVIGRLYFEDLFLETLSDIERTLKYREILASLDTSFADNLYNTFETACR